VSGYYTRTLLADTYTVTASAYSYLSSTITDVVITSDIATTQDFALTLAPTYTVSGTVTDSGTGLPLLAELSFTGSPVTVSSDPATGYYQAVLPQGNYIMHVTAPSHMPEDRPILVDHDQIQDFALDPLPCILLVDDDQNDPDVRSYFTSALNDLAYDYNVWDISTQGDPEEVDLGGYQHVLWTTGRLSSDTFTGANEAAVGAYLDAGGNFFLSSHEYLYNFGLTLFGTNYLGISSYQNDVQRSDVTGNVGNPIGDGLGPYSLIMPPGWLTNWSDNVSGPNSPFRWAGTGLNNSVNKEGETYRTVFFAWPFEGLSNLSARADVLGSVIDWFGGCEPPDSPIEGLTAVNDGPTQLGDTTTLTATVTSGTNVQYEWDFGDGITMTEQVVEHIYQATGTYTATVTATNGTSSASAPTTVTITDVPIEGLAAENNSPTLLGSTTTFTSTILSGSNVSYTWDFGDGITMTGQVVEHIYQATGTYTATVTATNSLGPMSVETVAIVYSNELPIYYYLSIVYK
jgi:PKD repeat protein